MNNRYKQFFAGVLLALILSGCAENGSEAGNEKIPEVDVATTPEVAAETTPKELESETQRDPRSDQRKLTLFVDWYSVWPGKEC